MSTTRATLLQHDQSFFDALVGNDLDRLKDLLTEDFILVGIEDGGVADRSMLLGLVESRMLRFPKIESFPDEAIVRFFGDMGIVVGRTGMNFTNADGTGFSASSRYTHVYVADARGTWRLTSAQGTAIKP